MASGGHIASTTGRLARRGSALMPCFHVAQPADHAVAQLSETFPIPTRRVTPRLHLPARCSSGATWDGGRHKCASVPLPFRHRELRAVASSFVAGMEAKRDAIACVKNLFAKTQK